MKNNPRHLVMLAAFAGMLPVTPAQAQYYGGPAPPPPLYPYVVQVPGPLQANRPYAVQVSPNTYVVRQPAAPRAYPYYRSRGVRQSALEKTPPRFDRKPKPADRGLIEELRKRAPAKRDVVNTTKIVREPPLVIETRRVVDDPPRIIERHHVVEDKKVRPRRKQAKLAERAPDARPSRDDNKKRVIEADAEVTILGPDRMTIQLFRKGQGPKANARAD